MNDHNQLDMLTNVSRRYESRRSSKPKLHFKKTKKIKYGEKRLSVRRMEFLHLLRKVTIMTLILPGDCTLQCGMWFWNHDS